MATDPYCTEYSTRATVSALARTETSAFKGTQHKKPAHERGFVRAAGPDKVTGYGCRTLKDDEDVVVIKDAVIVSVNMNTNSCSPSRQSR